MKARRHGKLIEQISPRIAIRDFGRSEKAILSTFELAELYATLVVESLVLSISTPLDT